MKQMKVITSSNIREIVNAVNQHNELYPDNLIQKEDIVSLVYKEGYNFLVYFN